MLDAPSIQFYPTTRESKKPKSEEPTQQQQKQAKTTDNKLKHVE